MNASIPFKDHAQFATLIDTITRRHKHHALLTTTFSSKLYPAFLNAFLQHLSEAHHPISLQNAELVYLDIDTTRPQSSLEKDLIGLRDTLDKANHFTFIVFTSITSFLQCIRPTAEHSFLHRQLSALLNHSRCRFLIFTSPASTEDRAALQESFVTLAIQGPTKVDVMSILKQQREELESYHQVIIPDDLLANAYALAEHYLHPDEALDQTLMLLDSSAARTSNTHRVNVDNPTRPVLSLTILHSVLSGWTQIPASHLSLTSFRLSDFIANMQEKVFGQEAAITAIAQALQQSQAERHARKQPYACFHFVGPAHAGKKTTALALTAALFQQAEPFYIVQLSSQPSCLLADVNVRRATDNHYLSLKEALRQTPYAVMMFTHIEQASPAMLAGLQEIILTGSLQSTHGRPLNFTQAIVILNTLCKSERLDELTQLTTTIETPSHGDLMQLVMSEQLHLPTETLSSPEALIDLMMTDIQANLPEVLHHAVPVVPFLPLDILSIEKIITRQLKKLAVQLLEGEGIELSYAPEVIRYAVNSGQFQSLQHTVEQAIASQANNANRSNQLYLQLNETGQILCCHWLGLSATARQHAT